MYSIYPEWCLMSDHTPLTITISIVKEYIATWKRSITKNSEEKDKFIKEVIIVFSKLDIPKILDISKLEKVVSDFANIVDHTWMKYSKLTNIMKHSKSWWNEEYNKDLVTYKASKSMESWKTFQKTVKSIKRAFFDIKI